MSVRRFILASWRYHWRSHLGVFLGVVVGAGILTGALVIGDSVRRSLKNIALGKLGKTRFVVVAGERFFTLGLSERMASESVTTAPVAMVRGIAVAGGGASRANNVNAFGVNGRFRQFSPGHPVFDAPSGDEAVLNTRLADKLNVRVGDEFVLRLEKAESVPVEIPFLPGQRPSVALRLKVKAIIRSEPFGNFSLKVSQSPPLNAFVSIKTLTNAIGRTDRENLMLVNAPDGVSIDDLDSVIKRDWRLADAGLSLKSGGEGNIELISDRIFIPDAVADAAEGVEANAKGIFTYFVNSIKRGDKSTPYSFVSALGSPLVPEGVKDDEIILSQWLADDLEAKVGDTVQLRYFVVDPNRRLSQATADFKVKSIVPIAKNGEFRRLTPDFPGLTDAEDCDDWDASLPLDLKRIRPKDETYWDEHGATPKAFITLAKARELWSNRFGSLTAIEYPAAHDEKDAVAHQRQLERTLRERLDPTTFGFNVIPIRERAVKAAERSVDFGQLFLGLSFFLIVSSLLLTVMAFIFSIENRLDETATLLSIGFRPAMIRRLALTEALISAVPGGLCGALAGVVYAKLVIFALGNVWRDTVGVTSIELHVTLRSLLVGGAAGIFLAAVCMWFVLRKRTSETIADLRVEASASRPASKGNLWRNAAVAIASALIGAAILAFTPWNGGIAVAGAFFGSGAAFLVAFLAGANVLLIRLESGPAVQRLNAFVLAMRHCVVKRTRTLTATALLACGVFLTIGVAANRHLPLKRGNPPSSGTGGFALYAETTVPITADLNSERGQRKTFGHLLPDSVSFVQARLKAGDDASCLNLNQISKPAILGVDPTALDKRGAFSFAATLDGVDDAQPWTSALNMTFPNEPNTIPAVADQNVITWSLGKKLGDTLTYIDERGRTLKLKLVGALANSILQGRVVISERNFVNKFPSIQGARVFFADLGANQTSNLSRTESPQRLMETLNYSLADDGVDVESARDRLIMFSRVENTYLSIFLALGGLGIILGSVGLGVVAARNIMERSGELAALRAIGFRRDELVSLLLFEHAFPIVVGLIAGAVAGFIATLPAILSSGSSIPFATIGLTLLLILVNGILWILVATLTTLKRDLLPALRAE